MAKKLISFILVFIIAFSLASCSSEVIRRKFIRKKKPPKGPPPIYHTIPEEQISYHELYKSHYLYWRSWEAELIALLGKSAIHWPRNSLKMAQCSREALYNLRSLKGCLSKEMGDKMDPFIEGLAEIDAFFSGEELTENTLARIKMNLEKHKRNVERKFSYREVKDWILPQE